MDEGRLFKVAVLKLLLAIATDAGVHKLQIPA